MSDKCLLCGEKYNKIEDVYDHMYKEHPDSIPKDFSASQFYYSLKTGKDHGSCIINSKPTHWNEATKKYNRFCDDPRCKDKYREEFKKRMIGKYGKIHLLSEPDQQKKMLSNRSISGKYTWSDGTEITYTGTYELDFLRFLDVLMQFDSSDIMSPSPHTYYYEYEKETKFYIPDFFIPSLNVEIEIKDGGDNANMHGKIQAVDKVKEKLKDSVMKSQTEFSYVKLTNKEYAPFIKFLFDMKTEFEKSEDGDKIKPMFIIGESYMAEFLAQPQGYHAKILDLEIKNAFLASNNNYAGTEDNLRTVLNRMSSIDNINYLYSQTYHSVADLEELKKHKPEMADKIDAHIKWLQDDFLKDIQTKKHIIVGSTSTKIRKAFPMFFTDEYLDIHVPHTIDENYVIKKLDFDIRSNYEYIPSFAKAIIITKPYYVEIKHIEDRFRLQDMREIEISLDKINHKYEILVINEMNDICHKFVKYPIFVEVKRLKENKAIIVLMNEKMEKVNILYPDMTYKFLTESYDVTESSNEPYVFVKNYPSVTVQAVRDINKGENIGFAFKKVDDTGLFFDDHPTSGLASCITYGCNGKFNLNLVKNDKDEFEFIAAKDIKKGKPLEVNWDDYVNNFGDKYEYCQRDRGPTLVLDEPVAVAASESSKELIYQLRSITGCGMMYCKKALENSNWDMEDAKRYLRTHNELIPLRESSEEILTERFDHRIHKTGTFRYTTYPVIDDSPEINKLLSSGKTIWIGTDFHLYKFKDGAMVKNENFDEIIHRQTSTVKDNDVYIYLGDFADGEIHDSKLLEPAIKKLKGIKIMVLGNNDTLSEDFYLNAGFKYVVEGFKYGDLIFTHQPIPHEKGTINIHGHFHGSRKYYEISYDNHASISTKDNDFKPILLKDILDKFSRGEYSEITESSEEIVEESSNHKPFYFYHLLPKAANIKEHGLLSPHAMIALGKNDMASKSLDKYRDRIVGGWNILPGRKAEDLSLKEVEDAVNKFREDKHGIQRIYLFKYPPHFGMGKNMDETLKGKRLLRIDINNPELRKLITNIDWGYEGSHTDNAKLDENYYLKVNEHDYFKHYDDNATPSFAALNHISVATKDGTIPFKFLEEIPIEGGESNFKDSFNLIHRAVEVLILNRSNIYDKNSITLYHGSSVNTGSLKPISKNMGPRFALPRYSVFLTDDRKVSYISSLLDMVGRYARSHGLENKKDYSYNMEKGIFYIGDYILDNELQSYLENSKLYIFHVKIDPTALNAGHVPMEFTVDKEVIPNDVEVIPYSQFKKDIVILSKKDMEIEVERYKNKGTPYVTLFDKIFYKSLKPERMFAKWYLTNFVDKPEVMKEGVVFSEADLERNTSEWKKEKGKNILYITGHIGSGKTSLALELAKKHGARVIHLDTFEHRHVVLKHKESELAGANHAVYHYFTKLHPELKDSDMKQWDNKRFFSEFMKFFKWIENVAHKDPDHLYIFEGIQIFGFVGADHIKGKPVIVKGTSTLTSYMRDKQRKHGNNVIGMVQDEISRNGRRIESYTTSQPFLDEFKRNILK
jgi:calcineurin-like phosphoesterase family protein